MLFKRYGTRAQCCVINADMFFPACENQGITAGAGWESYRLLRKSGIDGADLFAPASFAQDIDTENPGTAQLCPTVLVEGRGG